MSDIINFIGNYQTLQSIVKKATENQRLVVLDFFATWCGPCRTLGAQLPEIAKENPEVVFIKCDIDANQEVTSLFGVSSVPSVKFLIFKENEITIVSQIAGCNVPEIRNKIGRLREKLSLK
ncbi:hypothetical protein M9Y10_015863 [Tritrichomonas musculus]|uniref:Thioredoxin domain-containing protein n=1 Tax=Tritrichomonas musculus TaxID=1915356 RepID=A0ABR2I4Y5_9EUKA